MSMVVEKTVQETLDPDAAKDSEHLSLVLRELMLRLILYFLSLRSPRWQISDIYIYIYTTHNMALTAVKDDLSCLQASVKDHLSLLGKLSSVICKFQCSGCRNRSFHSWRTIGDSKLYYPFLRHGRTRISLLYVPDHVI